MFYANRMVEDSTGDVLAGVMLPSSRYLACAAHHLYGLAPIYGPSGKFVGMRTYDIGLAIPNINQTKYEGNRYDFKWCSFASIDGVATLFVVVKDIDTGKFHYLYLNNDSYDLTYGFTKIR